jgi:hypothetical protein
MMRLVMHLDVPAEAIERIAKVLSEAIARA